MICVALFAAALLPRLIGVDWHGAHPDENPGAAARVLSGRLDVASYYPPLLDYVTAVAFGVLYLVGRLGGWWRSIAEFRDAYFADPTVFLITGRVVVASLSATLPPLGFALLRSGGVRRRWAIAGGAVAILIPGSIFWAHIAKQDAALAPAFLFLALAAFRFVDAPERAGRRLLLAIALSVAVSVKQSAVFFAVPLLLLLLLTSLATARRCSAVIGAWAVTTLMALLIWIPLNIGIVLDPAPFLAAQRVQSQMSLRYADPASAAASVAAAITSPDAGLPVIVIALWFVGAVALVWRPPRVAASLTRRFRVLFLATAAAMLIVGGVAGARQPTYLWLPYTSLMAVSLAAVAVAYAAERDPTWRRAAALAVLAVMTMALTARAVPLVRQFLLPAQAARLAEAVRALVPVGGRVLSAADLSRHLPPSPAAATEVRARHERLARKYGVDLPPASAPTPSPYRSTHTVIPLPVVIGGLEDIAPGDVRTVVAYAWPLQPDEWTLDHWRDWGIGHFVLNTARGRDPVRAYRDFHREVAARCGPLAVVPGRRPLLGETEAVLYRCAI
jgi:hypothetical protein